jgi:hypothetical protein
MDNSKLCWYDYDINSHTLNEAFLLHMVASGHFTLCATLLT